ncbi:MAG: YbaN family protein [Candidatus Bathyarchaeota archaeon]
MFFTIIGTLFLGIGLIGIVIPVLPTTPFLLLAAACYFRGSERLHRWLINNRIFGEFIRNYMAGKGIKTKQKIITIIFLWSVIIFSLLFMVKSIVIKGLLIFIAAIISVHIITLPNAM